MATYDEKHFETELCEHLAANGWLYSQSSDGYDKTRALFPEDVFGWLEDTQPTELAKVIKRGTPHEVKQREQLLDRLVKVLDTPLESGGGTLNVLRCGFRQLSARLDMCQFKPETALNPATVERYGKVRVRVMRQVYFSTADTRSVDLVLFVNGLPVATLELKTDFTQTVADAKEQYRKDRQPKDPGTQHAQPLFGFGSRALVHFAVSNEQVWMTTRLAGDKTVFLPFNRGNDGGAGNPANPAGSATSYLWERVLQRDSWLNILGRFMHLETREQVDPITGEVTKSSKLLFPRYHQWEAVTELAAAARAEGPGQRYLVQHSAGSGKTNSIAWTAHQLARLHDDADRKVFDSVIVVTDRTVLDAQLQDAIRQIDGNKGVVMTIDRDQANRAGAGSKSGLLARALADGKLIIVVTLQTFPFALDEIRSSKALKGKRFAVIADEAHSSQTGNAAGKLKAILSADEQVALDDGGEVDTEALLLAEMTARATAPNVSYFAFTATPKPKTLELFGRPGPSGMPRPFHVYTMKQAIEEGYILDVLRGYHSYGTAFQIGQRVSGPRNGAAAGQPASDELVEQSAATKGLMRWVKLHPTNIAQKVQIIVEHFRANVAHLLDGHAKAMVVTDSRKAAVRYKRAMDTYIAKQGYAGLGTLVAFSGGVEDPETGPGVFTEGSMNTDLRGRDLRTAFATDEYKVMLVANKFQTGFDEPLLVAMYVDKQLSGVAAVQTLSRLNRTYRTPSGKKKNQTFVLDFVNQPDDIQAAFQPYYADAFLETVTDPNKVHDLATKLDQSGIYTDADIELAAAQWVKSKGNNALSAAMQPAVDLFKTQYAEAVKGHDATKLSRLDTFRKDVGTFVRLYDFLGQIVDYSDTYLEKRSIYLRLLERLIRPSAATAEVDLADVELTGVKQIDRGQVDISLGKRQGLKSIEGAGTAQQKDARMIAFHAVIAKLNELFGDEDFTPAQKESYVDGLVRTLLEDDTLVTQAKANSKTQFLESPDLGDAVVDAVLGNQTCHNKMADVLAGAGPRRDKLVALIGALVHECAELAA